MSVTQDPTAVPTFTHPGATLPPAPAPAGLETLVDRGADRHLRAEVLAELKPKVTRKDLVLAVPDREGYQVVFSVMLDADLLKLWTVDSTDKATGATDMFELALRTIAGQCKGLLRHGEPVLIAGKHVTFASEEFLEIYGSLDSTTAVRSFYGNDAVIARVNDRIMTEAQAGSLDPTTE